MNQSTYTREHDTRYRQSPVYEDADEVPLERDIEHRYRARRAQAYDDRDHTWYGSSGTGGMLAFALGAGALLTWLATRSGLQQQTGWTHSEGRYRQEIPRDETDELIASDKVEGTAVYDRDGEKIGTVHNFMVGKRTGRVAYAVISFGGFLGMGGGYHALPWNTLTYNEKQGGYVVPADKERLRDAPSHQGGEDPFSNPAYSRQVSDYWLVLH